MKQSSQRAHDVNMTSYDVIPKPRDRWIATINFLKSLRRHKIIQ